MAKKRNVREKIFVNTAGGNTFEEPCALCRKAVESALVTYTFSAPRCGRSYKQAAVYKPGFINRVF